MCLAARLIMFVLTARQFGKLQRPFILKIVHKGGFCLVERGQYLTELGQHLAYGRDLMKDSGLFMAGMADNSTMKFL